MFATMARTLTSENLIKTAIAMRRVHVLTVLEMSEYIFVSNTG